MSDYALMPSIGASHVENEHYKNIDINKADSLDVKAGWVIMYSRKQELKWNPIFMALDLSDLHAADDMYKQSTRVTELYTLIHPYYELKKPIPVKITYIESEVIGDVEELELYSFGKDDLEVLKNLNEEIIELFEELINVPDEELGKYPLSWKKFLQENIVKKDVDR